MDEGHPLTEQRQAERQHLHPGAVVGAQMFGGFVLDDVPQRLVVMLGDVAHHFLRVERVASRLAAIVHLATGGDLAAVVNQTEVAQVAGQPQLDQVTGVEQGLTFAVTAAVTAVGDGVEAADKALVFDQCFAAVTATTATGGITQAIGEGADTGTGHIELVGLLETGVVGHFTEVPAFTIEVGVRVDRLHGGQRLQHHRLGLVSHQVKAETVDGVMLGPHHQGVDHQLGHHAVFGGGVGAAGGVFHGAGQRVKAVVIVGHHLVEHRLAIEAGSIGVVIDHIHHHLQVHAVEGLDHGAELADALVTHGVGGIAAFRHAKVQWVVTPVEAVDGANRCHHRLSIARSRIEAGQQLGDCLLTVGRGADWGTGQAAQFGHFVVEVDTVVLVFRYRGDVEHRQQVDGGQAGVSQAAQVADRGAACFGKGQILAGVVGAVVVGAEVTDMGLVDHLLLRGNGGRLRVTVPATGLGALVAQVDHLRVEAVGRQAERIGVGHFQRLQLVASRMEQAELVAVVLAGHLGFGVQRPDAGGGIEGQRQRFAIGLELVLLVATGNRLVELQADALGGGSPQCKAGVATAKGDAQRLFIGLGLAVRVEGGGGVEIVKHTSILDAGHGDQRAIGAAGAHQHLVTLQLLGQHCGDVEGEGRRRGQMRIFGEDGAIGTGRGEAQRDTTADGAISGDFEAGPAGVIEGDLGGTGGGRPQQGVALNPVGAEATNRGRRGHGRVVVEAAVTVEGEDAAAFAQIGDRIGTAQGFVVALVDDEVNAASAWALEVEQPVGAVVGIDTVGQRRRAPAVAFQLMGRQAVTATVVPQVQPPAVIQAVTDAVVEDHQLIISRGNHRRWQISAGHRAGQRQQQGG